MSDISKIDKNFAVNTDIKRENLRFYSAGDAPFKIFGVFHEGGKYRRMPEAVAKAVSEQVESLHACAAGGRVRFVTDSPYIVISAKMDKVRRMPHFALTGVGGFDMYVDDEFIKCFVPPLSFEGGYSSVHDFPTKQKRSITINFPLYSDVCELYIGLHADALIEPATDYINEKPVVYYGSSITQGGCASRPGNSYQAIASRNLNLDYINLGFSGSARAEVAMMEYIASLDMSVFVYDYDHNAYTIEYLENTHEAGFKTVRNAHPNLPIIIMTRPNFKIDAENDERCAIIKRTYDNAVALGDKNVYLIEGRELMALCNSDGTVDGVHPTDFGFHSMANAVTKVLLEILNDN